MKATIQIHRVYRAGALALTLVLALAVLAAALPQPALAQSSCRATYVVQEGDSTGKIAHRYDLKWREIAEANDLPVPTSLKAGQELCIPSADSDDDDDTTTKGVLTVTVAGRRAFVTIDKLSTRSSFIVKVRSASVGVGGWAKLGLLKAAKNEKVTVVYSLPDELRSVTNLSVCLKNLTTDELLCRTAVNIP